MDQCTLLNRIVFVTSTTYNGNLGGHAGADMKCQERATVAGLSGTFQAWLSTDDLSAADYLENSVHPYVTTVNPTVTLAADLGSLLANGPATAINVNEHGDPLPWDMEQDGLSDVCGGLRVWTGTLAAGTKADDTCSNWTNGLGVSSGLSGSVEATGIAWTGNPDSTDPPYACLCNQEHHLYCIQTITD